MKINLSLVLFAAAVVLSLVLTASADDSSLRLDHASIELTGPQVEFELVEVAPATTVAWINRADASLLLRFVGLVPVTVCKAPRRFVEEPQGIFSSELLEPGDVASICFLEPGFYQYQVSKVEEEASEVWLDGAVSVIDD